MKVTIVEDGTNITVDEFEVNDDDVSGGKMVKYMNREVISMTTNFASGAKLDLMTSPETIHFVVKPQSVYVGEEDGA